MYFHSVKEGWKLEFSPQPCFNLKAGVSLLERNGEEQRLLVGLLRRDFLMLQPIIISFLNHCDCPDRATLSGRLS